MIADIGLKIGAPWCSLANSKPTEAPINTRVAQLESPRNLALVKYSTRGRQPGGSLFEIDVSLGNRGSTAASIWTGVGRLESPQSVALIRYLT